MTIGIATRAVAPAAYAHDSPIVDRTFDLLRFAARHRLQDAAAIPQRNRAGHEHDENADDNGRRGIEGRFPETPFHHRPDQRSEEHTSELQSLKRSSNAVLCLK